MPHRDETEKDMKDKMILIVEDDPRDEALTLARSRKHKIANDTVISRDGVEALD
jgi:two-component system response regulator